MCARRIGAIGPPSPAHELKTPAPIRPEALVLPPLALLRLGIGELGFFLRQQAHDDLAARLVGFSGQQPAEMLDV